MIVDWIGRILGLGYILILIGWPIILLMTLIIRARVTNKKLKISLIITLTILQGLWILGLYVLLIKMLEGLGGWL